MYFFLECIFCDILIFMFQMSNFNVLEKLGVGRRHPTDSFFSEGNAIVRCDRRQGVIQEDDEELCHEL